MPFCKSNDPKSNCFIIQNNSLVNLEFMDLAVNF